MILDRRIRHAVIAAGAAAALLLVPVSSANATINPPASPSSDERHLGGINCGPRLVLSIASSNAYSGHLHHRGGETRQRTFQIGGPGYETTYYNSGWTAVDGVSIASNGSIRSASRTCEA